MVRVENDLWEAARAAAAADGTTVSEVMREALRVLVAERPEMQEPAPPPKG